MGIQAKTYASGFQALKQVDLDIRRGEIFALLGPNGAGKTTLISIVCGIVNASEGTVRVDGHDIVSRLPRRALADRPGAAGADHRRLRDGVGDGEFSRGLFGKPPNPAYIEKVLRDLSLWDKKDNKIITCRAA
jgi:ABC-2 type transport system ATP-binding protein